MILRGGKVVSSYSQLDKFIKCPNSWWLRYMDKLKSDFIPSKSTDYGEAMHETLEFLFSELKSKFKVPIKLLSDIFKYNMEKRNIQWGDADEEMEYVMNGLIFLESIIDAEDDFKKLLMTSKILGVELAFSVPIEIQPREFLNEDTGEMETHDTVWINGFIDLVIEDKDGNIFIIDHKSSKKVHDKAKLRTDLQIPIYAIAIHQIFKRYPKDGYFNFTKLDIAQKVMIVEEVSSDMEKAMDKRGCKEIYCYTPTRAKMEIRKIFARMGKKSEGTKTISTPLCYWCVGGKSNLNVCKASHDWKPKEEQTEE